MKLVGQSPREPHRWMKGPAACHLLCGVASAGVAEVASTWSDCPTVNLRQEVRVGAWNVHSLSQDDQLPLLSRELGRLRVRVAALSEVRRPGSGTTSVGGYTYYWSGCSDGHHLQGTFYAKPTSVVDSCPRRDVRIILGDFNVSVHLTAIELAMRSKEIDHILVSTRWRILQNCRVFKSAEFCGTDHRLVVATLRVHFKTPQRPNDHPRVFHLDRLKDRECARRFAETICDRFTALDNLMDPVLL
ncbi:uncharacterized protein [Penaeus vannamei]|uniref:uncharacterized protein n=1 Tax=Penaeus vannamei TaxID=6689 RepID=UPI00387F68B6